MEGLCTRWGHVRRETKRGEAVFSLQNECPRRAVRGCTPVSMTMAGPRQVIGKCWFLLHISDTCSHARTSDPLHHNANPPPFAGVHDDADPRYPQGSIQVDSNPYHPYPSARRSRPSAGVPQGPSQPSNPGYGAHWATGTLESTRECGHTTKGFGAAPP